MGRAIEKKGELTLLRIVRLEEREADEETSGNDQRDLAPDVRRGAPVLLENTTEDLEHLDAEGSSKLSVGGLVLLIRLRLRATLVLESVELLTDALVFRGLEPSLVPVNVGL